LIQSFWARSSRTCLLPTTGKRAPPPARPPAPTTRRGKSWTTWWTKRSLRHLRPSSRRHCRTRPMSRPACRHLFAFNEEPHRLQRTGSRGAHQGDRPPEDSRPGLRLRCLPRGVLHKLVFVLGKLDPRNERWKERQIAKAREIPDVTVREKVLADLKQAFTANELDYGRKLYLIENCIYGVDIQPIAVQIAKLHFFISLVVDQRVNQQAENLGILALPNLETRFVAANTLIGLDRPAHTTCSSSLLSRASNSAPRTVIFALSRQTNISPLSTHLVCAVGYLRMPASERSLTYPQFVCSRRCRSILSFSWFVPTMERALLMFYCHAADHWSASLLEATPRRLYQPTGCECSQKTYGGSCYPGNFNFCLP